MQQWLAHLALPAATMIMGTFNWRRRLNFLLLGAVSGLLVALWLPTTPPPPPLLNVEASAINFIEVFRSQQPSLHFARLKDGWQMSAPQAGKANALLIQRIVEVSALRCPRRYLVEELDVAALELAEPLVLLHLNTQEVRFGAVSAEGLRYVQVGATVALCPDSVYPLLTSAAASFLSATLEIPNPELAKPTTREQ